MDIDWRHLLVLVHGFNNSESQAETSYGEYLDMLRPRLEKSRIAPDAVAKLHWPGNEAIGPFPLFDFAGYPIDVRRALQSVAPLVALLSRLIAARPGRRRISFVAHSLGCRLVVEVMCSLGAGRRAWPPLAVVSLMAAAVPVALAEARRPLAPAPTAAVNTLKAHSRADWVLSLAFPAGQSLAAAAGIEAGAYTEAIGRNGNPAGFGELLPRDGNGHSDYWTDEYAAAVLLVTIDAALRSLPSAAMIRGRDLPAMSEISTRDLESRRLPS